jgi:acyl dehydratase
MKLIGKGISFNDLSVGDKFVTYGRTITDTDITNFVNCVGMTELLFTNMEFVREQSPFKDGRPAPAALVYSVAEGLVIQSLLQGVGLAFLNMELNVEGPTLAGDTVHVEIEILEARQASKGARGLVRTLNKIVNQRGEAVITYNPLRMIKGGNSRSLST